MSIPFHAITAETPTPDKLAACYAALNARLDEGDMSRAVAEWEQTRRAVEQWSALTHLRFEQDTQDEARKAAQDYRDELAPTITNHETSFKTRLLAHSNRDAVARTAGAHALRLWETDITTFSPEIENDLQAESKLQSRYVALLASARIEIGGKTVNLSGLAPYQQSPDRRIRHQAEQARWHFFSANAAAFDEIYDSLVKLRTRMARKLGFGSFTGLGYRRMRRMDYGPADVAAYREQVRLHVTPLVQRFHERRREQEGWDRLHAWDEPMVDAQGNVEPAGDESFLRAQAQGMFEAMNGDLAAFYQDMNENGFLDLDNRPAKAPGGFCTSFPSAGMPFIFANFNGTHHDIDVFTHEMGHAFQNYRSRHLASFDYLWPTYESAEIHSMSLEHLAYPHIARMVGEENAARYRRMHLIQSIAFLPYGVCVDHFQHEVYANPDATPAERHAMWKKLEALYMPWRNWGDLAYPARGGRWQAQGHIYSAPFYYIDYTLAECCALQFWVKSREDYAKALRDYVALCGLGGSKPFLGLVQAAGLTSPFQPGVLEGAVKAARTVLGL
ncbi:M3 family oligoendopeptidase [Acidocella sp.]|uniref:M3 family oligoendopeptidase n=1 Tax=Acidocella sp. TaxID=50710 RepID=UPI003CFCBED2